MLGAGCFGKLGQRRDRVQDVGACCMRGIEQFSYACGVVVLGAFFVFVRVRLYCLAQSDVRIHRRRHWLAIAHSGPLEDLANVAVLRERDRSLLPVPFDVDSQHQFRFSHDGKFISFLELSNELIVRRLLCSEGIGIVHVHDQDRNVVVQPLDVGAIIGA